jgi:hypothetical protein
MKSAQDSNAYPRLVVGDLPLSGSNSLSVPTFELFKGGGGDEGGVGINGKSPGISDSNENGDEGIASLGNDRTNPSSVSFDDD